MAGVRVLCSLLQLGEMTLLLGQAKLLDYTHWCALIVSHMFQDFRSIGHGGHGIMTQKANPYLNDTDQVVTATLACNCHG